MPAPTTSCRCRERKNLWEKSPASRNKAIESDRVQEAAGARPGQAGQAPRLYYTGFSRAQLTAVENREQKTKRRSSTTPFSLRRALPNAALPSRTKMLQRGRESRMTPCSFTTPLPLHWVLPSAARAHFTNFRRPPTASSRPLCPDGSAPPHRALGARGSEAGRVPHPHALQQPAPHV